VLILDHGVLKPTQFPSGYFALYFIFYLYLFLCDSFRFIPLSFRFHSCHFLNSALFGMSTCFVFLFAFQFSFSYIPLQTYFYSSFFIFVFICVSFLSVPFPCFMFLFLISRNRGPEILMQNCPLRDRQPSTGGIPGCTFMLHEQAGVVCNRCNWNMNSFFHRLSYIGTVLHIIPPPPIQRTYRVSMKKLWEELIAYFP
jgi:hypothetical protein